MHQSLIIQHLFQVNSLEDVSRERLETFVEDFPSFGIGHYLLSRKLQKEDAGGFEEKTKLTCLYFSNPFWLQWLLENTDVGGQKPTPGHMEADAGFPVTQEWSAAGEAPASTMAHEEVSHVETSYPETSYPEVRLVETSQEEANHAEVSVAHPEHEAAPPVENVVTMAEEAFHVGPETMPALEVEAGGEEGPSAAEQLLRSIDQAREIRESLQKINTHFGDGTAIAGEELMPPAVVDEPAAADEPVAAERPVEAETPVAAETPLAAVEPVTPAHEETPIRDEEVPFVLDEPEPAAIASEPAAITSDPPAITSEPAAITSELAAMATEPVVRPAAAEPAAAPAEIVFEPLHTIDYFASQGIKFNLEDNPVDALGKQLKSFTDWLKTMRRLPQKHREVVPDRLAEEAIQNFAAHSIEGKEVLTEAMAEVLAKQGMRHRARVVYEKLSLLNPEKSAYFAAKIEQLNIL